jgi:hypothetical protein
MSKGAWNFLKNTDVEKPERMQSLEEVTVSDVNGPVAVGNTVVQHIYNSPQGSLVKEIFEPTPAEIEILLRFLKSSIPDINAFSYDGGYHVLVCGKQLCPNGAIQGSTMLYEAITRLSNKGLIHNRQGDGELYQLSTKGRNAAIAMNQQVKGFINPNYDTLQGLMPELIAELQADYDQYPINREVELLNDEHEQASNQEAFRYYYSTHPCLEAHFQILESHYCVARQYANVFRLSEQFISYLRDSQ